MQIIKGKFLTPLNTLTAIDSRIRMIEERLEALEGTIEILADKNLLKEIKRSLDDIKKGRYKDYADVNEFMAKFEEGTKYSLIKCL